MQIKNLYVQNKLESENQENLNTMMSKPLMVVYNLNSGETAEKIKAQILSNMPKKCKNSLMTKQH